MVPPGDPGLCFRGVCGFSRKLLDRPWLGSQETSSSQGGQDTPGSLSCPGWELKLRDLS